MSAGKGQKKTSPASGSADDIKAKFRAALEHKEHHDGPSVGVEHDKGKGPEAHGAAGGKREFRRKTG